MPCVYCDHELEYKSEHEWHWYECVSCHARSPRGVNSRDVDALHSEVYVVENYVCGQCEKHEDRILELEKSVNEYMERQDQDTRQIETHENTIKALRDEIYTLEQLLEIKDLDI